MAPPSSAAKGKAWRAKGRSKGKVGDWVDGAFPLEEMGKHARHVITSLDTAKLEKIYNTMLLYAPRSESVRLAAAAARALGTTAPKFADDACRERVAEAGRRPILPCRMPLTGALTLGDEAWKKHELVHLIVLARLVRYLLYGGFEKASGWPFAHQCGDCPARPWCGYDSVGIKRLMFADDSPPHFLCDGVCQQHAAWWHEQMKKHPPEVDLSTEELSVQPRWLEEQRALNPLLAQEPPVVCAAGDAGEAAVRMAL